LTELYVFVDDFLAAHVSLAQWRQSPYNWAKEAEMPVLARADVPEKKYLLAQVRQAIETSFSQLWYRFLDRVFSRSWRGLWNTVQLKIIYYNLRHAGLLSA